jgi:replicative DNA helicase
MQTTNDIELRALPPQELEAEQNVLGACLLESNHLVRSAYLLPGDFYKSAHRELFAAMQRIVARGEDLDVITLAAEVRGNEHLQPLGGPAYLSTLMALVPTAANFRSHERMVIAAAQRRQIIKLSRDTIDAAMENKDADAVLATCIEKLSAIRRHEGDEILPYSDIVNKGYDEIQRRNDLFRSGKISGIPTGFRDLDTAINGLQPGYIIVSGDTGMGKSALVAQIARNAAGRGHKVGVVSLEMGPEQIAMRDISGESDIPLSRLMAGTLHDMDWEPLAATAGRLHGLPIWGAFTTFTMRRIERVTDDMVQRFGVELMIYDYLQLENVDDHDGTREQEVTRISRMHKFKSQQHRIPCIVISSLNRSIAHRTEKRPTKSDLRESGSLEYDADVILFVYRDEVYNCKCPKNTLCLCGRRGKAELIIDKGRMLRTGTVDLLWHGNTTSFRDVEEQEL